MHLDRHNLTKRAVRTLAAILALVAAFPAGRGVGQTRSFAGAFTSASGDSLALPGEVYVLTAEELSRFDINTIEDIIAHLPGVSILQDGPPGSRTRYSIDGRTVAGLSLMVNGVPYSDPYNDDPLARFITLSRVRRVEVIFSSSPSLTGRASSGGIINIVIEEGGRKPPVTAGDFTWGGDVRKSRKAWFSSPDAAINGTIAYDEYMQDYFESVVELPSALVGKGKSRSILMDMTLRSESGDRVLIRLRTFEDAYTGTGHWPELRDPSRPPEEVRYSGMDSEIRYVRGGAQVSLRQRMVEMRRNAGYTSGLVLGGTATWTGSAGSSLMKGFLTAERVALENRLWGEYFAPDADRLEAGIVAGGPAAAYRWRAGLSGGFLSDAGFYAGGEAALARGGVDGFYQSLMIARRVRTPTPEELYQPDIDRLVDGTAISTAGDAELGCEISDEVSLGIGYGRRLSVDLFARLERDRIALRGSDPAVYASVGEDKVAGLRAAVGGGGSTGIAGFGYGWRLAGSWFAEKAEITPGVPSYDLRCGLWLTRPSFKKTEVFTVRLDASETGERLYGDLELDRYSLLDLSVSISVIGALVRFEMKNLFDERYQTVPGMYMPGRHYRFGINWKLFD